MFERSEHLPYRPGCCLTVQKVEVVARRCDWFHDASLVYTARTRLSAHEIHRSIASDLAQPRTHRSPVVVAPRLPPGVHEALLDSVFDKARVCQHAARHRPQTLCVALVEELGCRMVASCEPGDDVAAGTARALGAGVDVGFALGLARRAFLFSTTRRASRDGLCVAVVGVPGVLVCCLHS